MIGPKKLSTIRDELRHALGGPDKDPIRDLDRRMSAADVREGVQRGDDEVIQALTRFLQTPTAPRRKRKAVARSAGKASR